MVDVNVDVNVDVDMHVNVNAPCGCVLWCMCLDDVMYTYCLWYSIKMMNLVKHDEIF